MKTPDLTPINSSQIHSVGHDADTRTLTVKFHSGGVYQYANVTTKQHAALMGAESVGRALAPIKSNPKAHPFTKLS